MPIGQKMGSLKNLKQSMAKGGGAAWIKYVPKNGSMNVRFIQEPEEWFNYGEHWDAMLRKSYPCPENGSCPGCLNGDRKSSRYLTNAIDLDEQDPKRKDQVIPLQLPKDLANRLVIKYEKWGTLVDREIELTRSGDGLDTVYDLDAGVKDPVNLGQYTPLNLQQVLDDAYEAVFGQKPDGATGAADPDDERDELPPPRPKARARSAAAKVALGEEADVDVDDGVDVDEPEPEPEVKKPAAKKAAKKAAKPEPEFTPDVDVEVDEPDPEPEPEASPDVDDPDDDEWTEEALNALPLGALRRVARDEFDVETKGLNKEQIIDAIFEVGGVDDDDDAAPY
jgi:hypothetical protein